MTKKQKTNLIRIIVSAVLVIGLWVSPLTGWLEGVLYLIPYFIVGYDILLKAVKGIFRGQVFDENFLMAVATVGAMALGDWREGCAVMVFYQIGELFQSYAVGKSRRSISDLMDIRPDYANIETDGALEKVDPDDVAVGTIIVVQPGERIPIDGVVTEGEATVNTSALTGESLPRQVKTGDEAGEKVEEKKPEPINDTTPLYARAPQDCTDEDYKAFYRKVFHEYDDPLFWIHLNVDYPFKLKGILYFPKLKEQFGGIEGQIKLYSGQVFVADNIKEVIPEFLMLLKGVIDCADFPLNVSRSFLQNDGYVRRISSHITKKVADKLTGMFKTEREAYEGFWPDIHPFIKYGVMRDEKFAERMKDCLLFKTTEGKFLTLAEYKERNSEKLPGKMVYTSDAARQDAAIRLFTERGIDVAVLDEPIDVNFVSYMEYSAEAENKFKFCRVDAELDSLTSQDEAPALDGDKLTALVREAAGKDDLAVEVKPLANESIPLMLIEDEQTRRFNDMGRIYGRSEFTMPAKYSVVLNSRSETIRRLAEREKDERSVLLTRQLYDLAELSRQPLQAEQMTEFIRRSMQIVDLAAQM